MTTYTKINHQNVTRPLHCTELDMDEAIGLICDEAYGDAFDGDHNNFFEEYMEDIKNWGRVQLIDYDIEVAGDTSDMLAQMENILSEMREKYAEWGE